MEKAQNLSTRALVNCLCSFVDIAIQKDTIQNYNPLFSKCQIVLALRMANPEKMTELDINGIVVSYSKTQQFNKEFISITEKVKIIFNKKGNFG